MKLKGIITVLFWMWCTIAVTAKTGEPVWVKQDGYTFEIPDVGITSTANWPYAPWTTLWGIDDSVINAAIERGGELDLPDVVTYEGEQYKVIKMQRVLYGVAGLKKVVLPRHLVFMEGCLDECEDLSEIVFNECLSAITMSIKRMPSLTTMDFPESLGGVMEASLYGLYMREIDLKNIGSIGQSSCWGWPNVTRLKLPSHFMLAEYGALSSMTNLEELVLGEAEDACFSPNILAGCRKLRKIYARSMTPPAIGEWGKPDNVVWGEGLFDMESGGVDKATCVLYVPVGAKEAYAGNEYWGRFKNIVEYDKADIEAIKSGDRLIDRIDAANGVISLPPGDGEPVTVCDINGRVVYNRCHRAAVELAVSPGIYVLRVSEDMLKMAVR